MLILLILETNIYFITISARQRWTADQVAIIRDKLDTFFRTGKVPGKKDIDAMMGGNKFEGRTWKDIKNYVHNHHQAQKRKLRARK